ncbi:MAG: hypothetical protein BWY88_01158 [Synergistetes bacterium ADurb.Bin520]|nr:MAG: hypothetical protein BWY88_01158 [Synergistetes bacterium ADurb.Bin520]
MVVTPSRVEPMKPWQITSLPGAGFSFRRVSFRVSLKSGAADMKRSSVRMKVRESARSAFSPRSRARAASRVVERSSPYETTASLDRGEHSFSSDSPLARDRSPRRIPSILSLAWARFFPDRKDSARSRCLWMIFSTTPMAPFPSPVTARSVIIRSESVTLDMADDTTTGADSRRDTAISRALSIISALPTEEPPNFITIMLPSRKEEFFRCNGKSPCFGEPCQAGVGGRSL